MPSNSVRCQGIEEAATKVDRSSGGLTGEGLFMVLLRKKLPIAILSRTQKLAIKNLSTPNRLALRARLPLHGNHRLFGNRVARFEAGAKVIFTHTE